MGRVVRGRRRVVLSNPDLRNEGGRREARFAGVKRILVCDWHVFFAQRCSRTTEHKNWRGPELFFCGSYT